jgi:hypothetical protein
MRFARIATDDIQPASTRRPWATPRPRENVMAATVRWSESYRLVLILVGGVVGAAIGLYALPFGFIRGDGVAWANPENDLNMYLIPFQYFIHDDWRFPVFDLPSMNYPEGGSVLLNDAVPLAVLVSKAIASTCGYVINPFGWWVFLTYVLQGAFAVRVVTACGVRSWWASVGAAMLAVCTIPFLSRVGHPALSSQFVILWALALHLENVSRRRFTAVEHFVLSAVAILINPYLFVMVSFLQATTVATLWSVGALRVADAAAGVVVVATVVIIALAAGYGIVFQGTGSMRERGFGLYSWNLATLLIPPESYWGIPRDVLRDATGGQIEGEAYIGLGGVLIVVVCLVLRPAQVAASIRRHWMLVLALIAAAAYAASNDVYFGSHRLLYVPLPGPLIGATAYFRASGRFVWLLGYGMALLSLMGLFKWMPRGVAVAVLLIAVMLQVKEANVTFASLRTSLSEARPELLDRAQLRTWMQQHRRVFQFPSWRCGGLTPTARWESVEVNRELHIDLTAASLGIPNNSAYTSRPRKDCAAEARWTEMIELDLDTLYLLGKSSSAEIPTLALLARSDACVDAGWGFVCSRKALIVGTAAERSARIRLAPSLIQVCEPKALGDTTVIWEAPPGVARAEVRLGTPHGPLLATGLSGMMPTGQVVAGTTFYLLNPARPYTDDHILGKVTAYTTRAGCGSTQEIQ